MSMRESSSKAKTEKNILTYASTLWDELDGKELEELFEKQPQFAAMYDWSQLALRNHGCAPDTETA